MRPRVGALLLVLTTGALAVAALAGCGGDGESTEAPTGAEQAAGETTGSLPGAPTGEVTEPAEPGPPENDDEAEAVRVARSLVVAIDARDAAAACALLAPGALDEVRGARGDCESDLARVLGRRPPGGAPAWDGTRIVHLVSVVAEGGRARVTLEVFHSFSDRVNPSVEDDVIFLELRDGLWRVSQPDATLYRAAGYPEPPLTAYTLPRS